MIEKEMLKEEAQNTINTVYGGNEWEILEYKGGHKPCLVKHKCGLEKPVSRFSTFKLGRTKCECQYKKGRPKLTFEGLSKRISDITYGTYELIELKDSSEFVVNHKSCDRPPFKTSSMRFFTRGQRCACSKKGRVGRKPKLESQAEINNMIMENKEDAN